MIIADDQHVLVNFKLTFRRLVRHDRTHPSDSAKISNVESFPKSWVFYRQ